MSLHAGSQTITARRQEPSRQHPTAEAHLYIRDKQRRRRVVSACPDGLYQRLLCEAWHSDRTPESEALNLWLYGDSQDAVQVPYVPVITYSTVHSDIDLFH